MHLPEQDQREPVLLRDEWEQSFFELPLPDRDRGDLGLHLLHLLRVRPLRLWHALRVFVSGNREIRGGERKLRCQLQLDLLPGGFRGSEVPLHLTVLQIYRDILSREAVRFLVLSSERLRK